MRLIKEEVHSLGVRVSFFITESGHACVKTAFKDRVPKDVRQVFLAIQSFINHDYIQYTKGCQATQETSLPS